MAAVRRRFRHETIDAVIHLAGFKAFEDSTRLPLRYHQNNVCGADILRDEINRHGVKVIVFGSSHSVYESPRPSMPARHWPGVKWDGKPNKVSTR